MNRIILFLFLSALPFGVLSQEVPYHLQNQTIYDFIDELANKGIVDINTAVKPYSRKTIALALQQANGHHDLTSRQQKEVTFYLKDFNKELLDSKEFNKRFDTFYYVDTLFKVTVNPILGGQFFNNGDKTEYHRWGGAEFYGSIGKHWGVYGSLRDNQESHFLGGHQYLTKRSGAVYKGDNEDKDYSETRGGITYSWNWGNIGLHKNHMAWGSGYSESIIFSGRAPSYAYISFKLSPVRWLEFNYMHGWLVSEVIDSTKIYSVFNGDREVFANKYIAANMFTIKPSDKWNISFGNSIVYGDVDFNPAYLVPFLFYKSADHTYNSWDNWVGHNAQMFLDVSCRHFKNVHLYTSLFIDEIALTKMFSEKEKSNDVAIKIGGRVTDVLPDLSLTAEYTRIRPLVYEHFTPTITYVSNQYGLGSYLKDNAQELFISLRYKPIRGLDVQLNYTSLKKGKDYQSIFDNDEIDMHPEINQDQEEIRRGLPFMNEVRYKRNTIELKASYQVINDAYVFFEVQHNTYSGDDLEIYTNPYYLRGDNILSVGMNFGF